MHLRSLWVAAVGSLLSMIVMPGLPARAGVPLCLAESEILIPCHRADPQINNRHEHPYTPDQQAIATAIDQLAMIYYAQTAKPLPVRSDTVALVMRFLNAEPSEAMFVCDRMLAHHLAQADIDTADVTLDQIHQFLQTPSLTCMP